VGSTKLTLARKKPEAFGGDLLVYCLGLNNKDKVNSISTPVAKELKMAIRLGDFKGNHSDTLLIYPQTPARKKVATERVLFVGLGQSRDKSKQELRELCRKVGGTIAARAKELMSVRVGLNLPEIQGLPAGEVVECLVEGILLGDYRFVKYKHQKKDKKRPVFHGIEELSIFSALGIKGLRRGMEKAQNASVAACNARDMANEPGNGWTPASFARYGRMLAKKYKMNCTVLGKTDMKRLKMGGLLAVNQGSAEPPRLVILEYKTAKKGAETILIVGKGLTFDSGGVSLKPAPGMEDMKYDMCGGAAAIAAMRVVGEEEPNVNVVAIIPTTDNMGGSFALKPGDIIRHYGGITSEIINTDAEGRLILADSLAYGIKKFSPTCVVDLATLTGAVIMGLGHHRAGLLGNNQTLIKRVLAAGEKCGEPLWQLPLDEEYSKQIDSDVADIKNTGGRPAGTITAAAYLQKFVGDTPWTHLDIAGTAWDFTKKSYIPKGPSGTGVRTLVELIRSWKKLS
jgi:leucyl aminopeptidase